jgi:hypothetical protein
MYPSAAYSPVVLTIGRTEAAFLTGFFTGPIAAEAGRMVAYFEAEPAAVSVNVPCFANMPVWHKWVTEALEARRNSALSV